MRADMLQTPPIEIPTGGGTFSATIKWDVEPHCGASSYDNFAQCHNLMGCGGPALSAWDAAWGPTLKLLPKTDSFVAPDQKTYSVICLPAPAKLDKVSLQGPEPWSTECLR